MAITKMQLGPLMRASRKAQEVMAAKDLEEWQREYRDIAGRFIHQLGLPDSVMEGDDASIAAVELALRNYIQAVAESWAEVAHEEACVDLVLGFSFYIGNVLLKRTTGHLQQSKFGDLHVMYLHDTQGKIAERPMSIFLADTARGFIASMALAEPTDMIRLIRIFSRRRPRRKKP